GDIFGLREIEHSRGNVFRPRPAPEWQAFGLCRELRFGLTWARQSWPRCDCVYPNPGRQRLGERAGGHIECALAQGIREKGWCRLEHTLIKNVDDRRVDTCRRLSGECL